MAPITPCSGTRVSTDFHTLKVKSDFFAWLRRESVRRGIFLYDLVEELASWSLLRKKPWRDQSAKVRESSLRRKKRATRASVSRAPMVRPVSRSQATPSPKVS